MFIGNLWRKLKTFCSFKLLILSIIVVWLLNVLLFYHLKSLGYRQTTVNILQSPQDFSNEKFTRNAPFEKNRSRSFCKKGNFSVHISNEILLLKEKLGKFYYTRSDSYRISERCHRFVGGLSSFIPSLSTHSPSGRSDNSDFQSEKLIKILKTSKIIKVENAPKGTQLKLLAHMENNLSAIIKPKWYSPFDIISGPVYAGKDRHYGEILAFYLSILLDIPRVPAVVSRKFDLKKEIILNADEQLLNTFLTNGTQTCFYGVCPYCNPSDLLCLDSPILEGAVIHYLSTNLKLKLLRHPWRRTYRCNLLARWEVEESYCNAVRHSKFYSTEKNQDLFFDLIDTSIFDFLISNGDRHHFEFIDVPEKPRILLLDNGKSFGNPFVDHIDILAPLYHCCLFTQLWKYMTENIKKFIQFLESHHLTSGNPFFFLRNSTWNNLLQLRGGNLSKWLQYLLTNSDDIVVNKMHFKALDRRLMIVFSVVEYCFSKKGSENVLTAS